MKSQNEYHYKIKLKKAISKFLEDITINENDLGWIPDELDDNMTEAAFLILKQNKDVNDYMKSQDLLK